MTLFIQIHLLWIMKHITKERGILMKKVMLITNEKIHQLLENIILIGVR